MNLDALAEKVEAELTAGFVCRDGSVLYSWKSDDALHHVRSVSKSMLSIIVHLEVEKGTLALDDPASYWLPGAVGTAEEMLTMTSGRTESLFKQAAEDGSWSRGMLQPEDTAYFHYNNADSYLLARLVEQASGKKLETLFQEHIADPAGLDSWEWDHSEEGAALGGYGLRMLPGDLFHTAELLSSGKLISEPLADRMLQPKVETGMRGQKYARHWWMSPNKHPVYYAAGRGGQLLLTVPDLRITAVFLGNLTKEDMKPFTWFLQDVLQGV
ncbi:serine hydrolase domain-containing protein [Alkalicoccus chagannorensis]|uniref:serine hydrolase domain-containing protein n=1 Tax=Alkalicoccus chagannorensis TaxID=427072 RepID=UPI00041B2287|nr:serine hydrolase [Alkalicoccus chagannorensis]